MLSSHHSRLLAVLAVALLWLTACTAATPAAAPAQFTDPLAYCAAAGTIDAPDARYTGPQYPEAITQGLIAQGLVVADAPKEIVEHYTWRCAGGKVRACHFGNNLPCTDKADTNKTPWAELNEFCTANPDAEVIPAVVTGRATVYEWRCQGGTPQIVKQVFTADPQGYIAEFWYTIEVK